LWLASYLVKMSWGKWLGVALVLVWSALAFVQTGVWKNSHTLFSHAVKAQPMDTLAWANLGSVYQRSGDYEKGVEYHSKAVSISKNEYNSWYNLGYCWEKMGDKEKAMENYERSLEAYPRYIPAMKNWGSLLEEEGDKMAARDLFWRAAEADRFREEAIVRRLLRVELELRNTDGIRQLLQKMAASGNRYSPELEAGIKQLKQQVGYSN